LSQAGVTDATVNTIFQFVYDNIDFIPTYGLHKGGFGALVDGSGNAADQVDLMVQLLVHAGFSASNINYVFGVINLTAAQWSNWLGVTDTTSTGQAFASQILSNGGIGNTPSSDSTDIELEHCWLQYTEGTNNYVFDPAFKTYTYTTGIDLATALGYDFDTFIADANSGSDLEATYVKKMNTFNITTDLTAYSKALFEWIQTNMPGATFDQILGGRAIVPSGAPTWQTSLPYVATDSGYTTLITGTVPNAYCAFMHVQFDLVGSSYTVDKAFRSSDVYGQRMTLWFDSDVASLYLNGVVVGGPSSAISDNENLVITVSHPYASDFADSSGTASIYPETQTTIGTAWGISGSEMLAIHQQAQNQAIADGVTYTAENMLGQSLLLIWDNLAGQHSRGVDMVARMGGCTTVLHHIIGAVGHRDGSAGKYKIVNSFLGSYNVSVLDSSADIDSVGYTSGLLFHAMEGAAHAQVMGTLAADTTSVIAAANVMVDGTSTLPIYLGNSTNWTTGTEPVQTTLSGIYPPDQIDDMNSCIAAGGQVLAPGSVTIPINGSNFSNYIKIGADGASLSGQIFGAKGAISTVSQDETATNSAASDSARQADGFGVPAATATESSKVNYWNGRFEYSSTDLTVGNQGAPYCVRSDS
jgi:hypothetical protein